MNLLYLTVLLPFLGFLWLALSQGRCSENCAALIGSGAVGAAALVTLFAGYDFIQQGESAYTLTLWHWIELKSFAVDVSFTLDGLSLTMLSVVTGVGFLIHLFASWYMRSEEGYSRFFAYTNLFIASMVVLVLADNLLLMYLGWEGVGLCSYLLIGFYYKQNKNGAAAMKAFIITRIGDVFLALALFILYHELGTLNFRDMAEIAPVHFAADNSMLCWATLLLLGGAVGKSAQLPLQTWLADAMAGPTPVSALIHAATMVTAGVYLIARTHGLFLLTPDVLYLVAVTGAVTLLLAGFAALVQTDIKRILAYSTMSQIGYMFLALGVQAWDAAIFHLMTHAFFKALLFLASGSVILACHHEQNIFKMGGLYKRIPLTYACFLVGGGALSALPLITSGYFSKDAILAGALVQGHSGLMVAGLIGALMTSLYTFRMIMVTFHGEPQTTAHASHAVTHHFPLIVLLLLSTFIGAMIVPPLQGVLPATPSLSSSAMLTLEMLSGGVAVLGVLLAVVLWRGKRRLVGHISASAGGQFFRRWWFAAWCFDALYAWLFVRPYLFIAHLLRSDPVDQVMSLPATFSQQAGKKLLVSENGFLRWYIAAMGIGAVVVVGLLVVL
ncbi:MAG: NADH-quinone oxidoreductase subunit L [Candidatus Erwinia impunctatus]|nr:NADH-quinone oxidoreductase subunit L [Culicoides impunctatus]